jgi:hypothetical protein
VLHFQTTGESLVKFQTTHHPILHLDESGFESEGEAASLELQMLPELLGIMFACIAHFVSI